MGELMKRDAGNRKLYDLLTAKLAPWASEGDSIHFDRIVSAPVDTETVGLVAEALVDADVLIDRERRCRRAVPGRAARPCCRRARWCA